MEAALIVLLVLAGLAFVLFGVCFVVMRVMFYSPPKLDREDPKPDPLMGEDLPAFVRSCTAAAEHIKAACPHERVSVKTDDGLTLCGDFYLNEKPTDKTILCVHGYNTSGYEDFSPMVEPILRHGYNCFLLNHRRFGGSEGKYTGFGILESRDMLKNTAHLPAFPLLDILCLECRLLMKLDLKGSDSRKCLAQTKLPVLFVHGDADAFVPSIMAKECFDACAGEKQLVIYEGAGHGQSHFKHPERYEADFFGFADRVTGAT